MNTSNVKNEWLAELLSSRRDLIAKYWIEDIRAENIPGYHHITDEQLLAELPPTVDSMIHAFRTGDTEGPRQHSVTVIQHRLAYGFQLPDLQMSLHALETAVMRIVQESDAGTVKEYQALQSASTMYYQVALIAAGVYEKLRAEQQRRFITAYEFGITLSRNLDLSAILDTSVRKVAEYIGGESSVILLAEPHRQRDKVRAYYNLDENLVEAMPDICESLGCRSVDMDSTDMHETSCAVADVRIHTQLENWSEMLTSRGYLSIVDAPLLAKQKRLGSLVVLWREAHTVTDSELDYLFAMAGHIANAIQNAILYEEAQGKWELGVLLEASRLFTSSLNTEDILNKTVKMAARAVNVDLAIVFTEDHLRKGTPHMAYYAASRKAENALQRVMDVVAPEGETAGLDLLLQGFSCGKPAVFDGLSMYTGLLEPLSGIVGSCMVAPMKHKNTLIGTFALVSLNHHSFSENDLLLAEGLADLAAVAIENAQLYEVERNISETLQRSFLPSHLPHIEGYDSAAYYRPAMTEMQVGGDFYDVFVTRGGYTGVIIGDVSGKGLQAAVPTVMGKYMVRAYATEDLSPSSVLKRFNRAYCETPTEDLFMTVFYGTLNPGDNTFTYVSAGHNPPLLYSAESNQVTQIHTTGICIGIIPETQYEDMSIQLQPGNALLLYTDGATDVKGDSGRLEVEGLEELFLKSAREPAEQIVRNISDGILDFGHNQLPDDVALVVLKRNGIPG